MKRALLSLSCLILVILSCTQTPSTATSTPEPPHPGETISQDTSTLNFTIALEYAIPGLGEAYTPSGLVYAKPQGIFGLWKFLEPEQGVFNWKPLDDLVIEYQQAGFKGIQLLISAESTWASISPPSLINTGNTLPKEEFRDDYVSFVKAFVERYDGDGVDDVPGLLYPVHHYGLEREFTGYWPSDADDYIELAKMAYPAIHEADPQAEVMLNAILMVDVFDGNPDPVELERRLTTPQQGIRKSVAEIRKILAACDTYDIIDFHSLGDYVEIIPTTTWLREQLEIHGCDPKPIWIGDAFSMSALVGYGGRPAWPGTEENLDQVIETFKLVANPKEESHQEAKTWLYGLMAEGLVKKIVVSAGAGLAGINIGNLEDWKTNIPAVDAASVQLVGASMFMGMMDTRVTQQQSGEGLPPYRTPTGPPRPAFYALKLTNQKITGFATVEKLDLGENIWAYLFNADSDPLWVLWYDTGTLYFPGETPPEITIELPFSSYAAQITLTPTQIGQEEPENYQLEASDGFLTITLGQTPLFIEVTPGQD
jgi:hypothetical protein